MPDRPDIPGEAAELLARRLHRARHPLTWDQLSPFTREYRIRAAAEHLTAVAPALRKQGAEEEAYRAEREMERADNAELGREAMAEELAAERERADQALAKGAEEAARQFDAEAEKSKQKQRSYQVGLQRFHVKAPDPAWPPHHGQIWFDKQTGLAVGIGTVCRTELGDRVSGTIYRYESNGLLGEFELPLQEFRERHRLLGDDPDAARQQGAEEERERLTGEIKERLEAAAKKLVYSAQTDGERALFSVASSLVIAALETPAPAHTEEKGEGRAEA